MHFVTGRAEERLSFDLQREIAERLGYTSHPGMQDVERFMKHYFLVAKDVGDLTAILCAGWRTGRPSRCRCSTAWWRGCGRARRGAGCPTATISSVDNNRINVADADVFQRDPVNLIRLFRLAQKHNLAFHPDAMRLATRSLQADRRASCARIPRPIGCSWRS